MFYSRFVRFCLVFIPVMGFSYLSHAAESDFASCASKALEGLIDSSTQIQVDTDAIEMGRVAKSSIPKAVTRLEMDLTTASGIELGSVTCELDARGNVASVHFDRETIDLAAN